MVCRMESAFLRAKIIEVYQHLHKEKFMEGQDGWNSKMVREVLLNIWIIMNQKVLLDNTIVTHRNAMLLVPMKKVLHLDGCDKYYLKHKIIPQDKLKACNFLKMEQ
jgi:hypothetical protein